MSNEMTISRDLAIDLLDGLRITQERARKELRALLAKPAEQHQGDGVNWKAVANEQMEIIQKLKAAQPQGEPVSWQFYHDGKWWNGDDRIRDHRKNTEEAGYKIRDLFAEQPAQKYDDTLLPFMELMRRELHANSHKGDRPEWLKMTASTALEEIAHHFNKLDEAVGARDNPQIREYAADIANICMMLLDICGELAFVRQPEPVSSTSDKYKAELYDEVWQLARDMGFGNVTDALTKLKKQPAPVAVVLPERKPEPSVLTELDDDREASIWNTCLDEVARLNPPQQ